MQIKTLAVLLATATLISCGSNDKAAETAPEKTMAPQPQNATPTPAAKPAVASVPLDSEKDLVCGMPIKAGVEDTTTYKGKVYGFCAKECKDEFLKTPEKFVAAK